MVAGAGAGGAAAAYMITSGRSTTALGGGGSGSGHQEPQGDDSKGCLTGCLILLVVLLGLPSTLLMVAGGGLPTVKWLLSGAPTPAPAAKFATSMTKVEGRVLGGYSRQARFIVDVEHRSHGEKTDIYKDFVLAECEVEGQGAFLYLGYSPLLLQRGDEAVIVYYQIPDLDDVVPGTKLLKWR